MKGCICLDIDGTITADPHYIPQSVLDCFRFLHGRGWEFTFATGRTCSFALKTLREVDFPFFLAVQNGADLLHMPEKKLLSREYLPAGAAHALEKVAKGKKEDFLIYAGWEHGDFCYYRPNKFSSKFRDHIKIIECYSDQPWRKVEEFNFSLGEAFPLLKYLGDEREMKELHEHIKEIPGVQVSCIKDPISEGVYENLVTAPAALKGECIRKIREHFPEDTIFIAAGDDDNDVSMLKEADIAIVMGTAPEIMRPLADIHAKPAKELGIIEALLEATGEKR